MKNDQTTIETDGITTVRIDETITMIEKITSVIAPTKEILIITGGRRLAGKDLLSEMIIR